MKTSLAKSPADFCVVRWREALHWRRAVDEALAPLRLTLTDWLVLEATLWLTRKNEDAVSQQLVCARAQLDKATVSQRMQYLDKRNYVSRGPEASGTAYRVFVTEEGVHAATRCRALVELASVRALQSATPTPSFAAIRRPSDGSIVP